MKRIFTWSIHKLAEITGYSIQICRKYLRAEALPETLMLLNIAKALDVTPGWLLFGAYHHDAATNATGFFIQKKLLFYIFKQARALYNCPDFDDEIADFLVTLAEDVSQITSDEAQAKKIIDLGLQSAMHFHQRHRK